MEWLRTVVIDFAYGNSLIPIELHTNIVAKRCAADCPGYFDDSSDHKHCSKHCLSLLAQVEIVLRNTGTFPSDGIVYT